MRERENMDRIVRDESKCEVESSSSPAKKPRNEEGVPPPPTPPPPSYSSSGGGGGGEREIKTKDPRSIIQVYQYDPADEENYLDVHTDGLHDMTRKEMEEYSRQIEESEGFDVMHFPLSFGCGKITPILHPDRYDEDLKAYSELALQEYNDKENTKLEFVKVVKTNIGPCCGIAYYITFDVKDADAVDGPTLTFQALVNSEFDRDEVVLCRPKKTN